MDGMGGDGVKCEEREKRKKPHSQ